VRHTVRYKPAAAAEVTRAIGWYGQPEINQATAFIRELERTEAHLTTHPELYQRVEDEIRRAILRRFPYSLFYVIEQDQVIVLACMHQHRKPKTREEFTGP
jgi:plasmid stabilization system protein ParE